LFTFDVGGGGKMRAKKALLNTGREREREREREKKETQRQREEEGESGANTHV
jgi:hypothetical protein